jgi:hypothetical protein
MKLQAKISGGGPLLGMLLLVLLPGSSIYSQTIPMQGDTFWLNFASYHATNHRLCICSQQEVSGKIFFYKNNSTANFEVGKDTCIGISVPILSVHGGIHWVVEPLGVHITASGPVTVYNSSGGENNINPILSSVNGWPHGAQGTLYYISTYLGDRIRPAMNIMSQHDSANVEITFLVTVPGNPSPPGVPYTVWLGSGKNFNVQHNTKDLTGTLIRSLPVNGVTRPLSVYSGRTGLSSAGNVFVGRSLPNAVELPVEKWGTHYHSVPHLTRKGDALRMIAAYDSTVVSINGTAAFTLDAGQFADTLLMVAAAITSTKPLGVHLASRDMPADTVMDSASFRYPLLSDENRFTRAVFTSDYLSDSTGTITARYLSLVCKTAYTGMVRLDGVSIGNQFIPYPADPQWSYAQMPVSKGLHILEADSGVLGYYYAYGYVMGYGHLIAGSNQVLTGVVHMPDKGSTIMVYPNPMNSTLWVQAAGAEPGYTRITVTGIHGREEYRHEAVFGDANWQHEISTGHLARGVYFIRVQSGNSVKVLKVVKM